MTEKLSDMIMDYEGFTMPLMSAETKEELLEVLTEVQQHINKMIEEANKL